MALAPLISPIDKQQQQRVAQEVQRYLLVAENYYQRSFPEIPVLFDIKGKTAGMYRVKSMMPKRMTRVGVKGVIDMLGVSRSSRSPTYERCIRFNPWLFAKYADDSWCNTIPHEVAHYVTDCLFGLRHIRPHGQQWRDVMRVFGAKPTVRANYDLRGIPVRKITRYAYRCDCRTVELTAQRHRKIQSGEQRYRCKDCAVELMLETE
ncbi:SprT family zinc-dependent metalloprotease [Eionea flava]